jgi:hypothetical protein
LGDAMGLVDQAVEDGVGNGLVARDLGPAIHGELLATMT